MADEFLHALPRGTRLEEYEIESVLGHGGFGITYLGRDVVLGLYLAIKEYMPADLCVRMDDGEIRPKSESSVENFDWGLDRFVSEAKLLAMFSHPNIVPVQRYFTANGTAYLAMPFQEGESLGDLIHREDILSPEKLKSIVVPCLKGLEEVHKADFLHRDIKPDNIFIREDGSPILLDFGAARQALGGKTRAITAVATPGFAPMEQYFADGNQGPWTDIYAMACVMYRAIGGKMPPESPARVEDDPMVPLGELAGPEWDRGFLNAVERGMAPKAKDRPQNVGKWLDELYAAETTGRVAPPPPEAGATIAMQEAAAPRKADPGATIIDRDGSTDGAATAKAAARSGPEANKPRSGGDAAAKPAPAKPGRPKRGAAPAAKPEKDKAATPPPAKRERKSGGVPVWAYAAGTFVVAILAGGIGLASLGLFDSGNGGGSGSTGGGNTIASTGAGSGGETGSGASEIGDGGGGASGEGGDGGDGATGEGAGGATGGDGGFGEGSTGGGSAGDGSSGATDEAAKRAEEEAKMKAEAEAKKKAKEEARKKAEREAKKKAEEEARKKAEQEAKAAAAPKVAGATVYRFKSTRMPTVKQAYTITLAGGGALIGKYDFIGGPGGAAPGDPGKDRGKWWMKGSQLCTKWSKWEGGGTVCYTLKKKGNSVHASGGGLLAGKIR